MSECRKTTYRTRQYAERVCAFMDPDGSECIEAYRHPPCGGWHVGHPEWWWRLRKAQIRAGVTV